MDIREVLRDFIEYNVVYMYSHKVLLINKPIEVKRFVELKNKLRNVREEIKDIIVEV